jgi:hypothetical protein
MRALRGVMYRRPHARNSRHRAAQCRRGCYGIAQKRSPPVLVPPECRVTGAATPKMASADRSPPPCLSQWGYAPVEAISPAGSSSHGRASSPQCRTSADSNQQLLCVAHVLTQLYQTRAGWERRKERKGCRDSGASETGILLCGRLQRHAGPSDRGNGPAQHPSPCGPVSARLSRLSNGRTRAAQRLERRLERETLRRSASQA